MFTASSLSTTQAVPGILRRANAHRYFSPNPWTVLYVFIYCLYVYLVYMLYCLICDSKSYVIEMAPNNGFDYGLYFQHPLPEDANRQFVTEFETLQVQLILLCICLATFPLCIMYLAIDITNLYKTKFFMLYLYLTKPDFFEGFVIPLLMYWVCWLAFYNFIYEERFSSKLMDPHALQYNDAEEEYQFEDAEEDHFEDAEDNPYAFPESIAPVLAEWYDPDERSLGEETLFNLMQDGETIVIDGDQSVFSDEDDEIDNLPLDWINRPLAWYWNQVEEEAIGNYTVAELDNAENVYNIVYDLPWHMPPYVEYLTHYCRSRRVHNDIGPKIKNMALTKLFKNVKRSTDFIMPQGKELNDKDFARSKYEKHKRGRVNIKEQEQRLRKANAKIQKLVKEKEALQKKLDPHALGDDFMSFVGNLSAYVDATDGDCDTVIRHAENVLLLAYNVRNATCMSDMFVAIIQFMKMYLTKSISGTIHSMLREILDGDDSDVMLSPEGELVDRNIRSREILDGFDDLEPHTLTGRDILDGWELFKTHGMHKNFTYLLCAAMSCSICSIKEIDWSIAGVQLIKAEAFKETLNACDLLDKIIHVFVWVEETGWICIKEQSLAPILYTDQRMRTYYTDCTYVIAHADTIKAGNMENPQEYERKLDEVLRTTSKLQAVCSPTMKEVLQRKYATLINIKQDIIAKSKNTQFRFAPLGISINGGSSIGKSNIAELTMKIALNAMGASDSKEGIITLNESDKYDSTYTSDVVGVHIDDAANIKADFAEKAPTQKYLMMFNSVAAQAVKAELYEKGCVFFNFLVGIITTNVKDLDARVYSNCPEAILRRFIHVNASVKPEYRVPGGTSLNTDHPELINEQDPSRIIDVWQFDIEEVVPGKQGFHVMTVVIGDRIIRCKDLDLRDYLIVITELARKHSKKQKKEVQRNKVLEDVKCCGTCNMIPSMCYCAQKIENPVFENINKKHCNPVEAGALVSEPHGCVEQGHCEVCNAYHGQYDTHGLVEQVFIEALLSILKKYIYELFQVICIFRFTKRALKLRPVREIRKVVERRIHDRIPFIIKYTPRFIYRTSWCANFIENDYFLFEHIEIARVKRLIKLLAIPMILYFLIFDGLLLAILVFISIACTYWVCELKLESEYRIYKLALSDHRDAISDYAKEMRDTWKGPAFVGVSIATISMILLAWNSSRKDKTGKKTPGEIDPNDPYAEDSVVYNCHDLQETPQEFDEKPGWFGFLMEGLGLKVRKDTVPPAITSEVLRSLVPNLMWGTFTAKDMGPKSCGVFFPRKSVMLFPKHMLHDGCSLEEPISRMVTCTVFRPAKRCDIQSGRKFTVVINPLCCYYFPEHDLMAAYVPNCPDLPTKTQWFPDSRPTGSTLARILIPNAKAQHEVGHVTPEFKVVGHKYMDFYGAKYKTKLSKPGVCMAPIVSESKQACIIGLHVGGSQQKGIGVCQTIVKKDLLDCYQWLNKNQGYLSSESWEIPKKQYNIDLLTTENVHPKAKYVKSLEEDAYVDIHGSTALRAQQRSVVVPSMLSPTITKVCGVPQKWGKPKLLPNWKPYNQNIGYFSHPAKMFDPLLLRRARDDWLKPLLPAMDEYCTQEDFRPLTFKESIMGIPGKKFIDPLPMDTGIGFPLFGKKNKEVNGEPLHFTEIRDGEILLDRIPKPHIVKECERLIGCWKENKRAYPVTSSTLKDTPTPLESEKVRVFQAAPVAMSLMIRKYFLPVARFLHFNAELSESAVGINAFSRDWERLNNHMEKYAGEDKSRIIGWDYSKYDVRMNSQIVRCAWECFIRLAEQGGYDQESLDIMKAMIVDIAHPLMDVNGTMMTAYNMNTSGNNMTVDVNGTGGSILCRMGFFDIFPLVEDFREHVAIMTYGDDNKGSVEEEYKEFNFLSFREFLARHDMKITLPDKSDDERGFLRIEESDFLKRISNYIPEIGASIGKLDEDSIFKSLHCNLKSSKATEREVAASCIETAMHEWFAYGRDHYEMRRKQMQEVTEKHEMDLPVLEYSFDNRVAFWREKYPDEPTDTLITPSH